MSQSAFCIATSEEQANHIVERLQLSGFPNSDISVIAPDPGKGGFAHVKSSKAPEGIAKGVATGGIAGGALGLLVGIGALAIPGLGAFIAAGPIMAALRGAAVGAATGGLVGGLIGMGIPEIEARRYEDKLRRGNYLISAHAATGRQLENAQDIFEAEHAEDISVVTEVSAPRE